MLYSVLASLLGLYLCYRLFWISKLPAGPTPWPLLGHIYHTHKLSLMARYFRIWKAKYGDIFTIYLGPTPFVVLTSKESIREAFITKGNDFSGRLKFLSTDILNECGKNIIFGQPSPVWKTQRQLAHTAIRKYASGSKLEESVEKSFNMVEHAVNQSSDGVINIPNTMTKVSYNFLASACFGKYFNEDDPWFTSFVGGMKKAMDDLGHGLISDFIPALAFLEQRKITQLHNIRKLWIDTIEKEFQAHKEVFDKDIKPRDLTDEILLQIHNMENSDQIKELSHVTSDHLKYVIFDTFAAGGETTRTVLSLILAYLAKYPKVQAKLHQELDDVLGSSERVTLALRERLVYTKAVVHEVMRLKPVVPIGLPRVTTRDTTIGQFKIPKGTAIVADIYGVQNDPRNFPHPDEFLPERWIDDDGNFQTHAQTYLAFSLGRRMCIGDNLAREHLQLLTATLFHKYTVSPVTNGAFELPLNDALVLLTLECNSFELKLVHRKSKSD